MAGVFGEDCRTTAALVGRSRRLAFTLLWRTPAVLVGVSTQLPQVFPKMVRKETLRARVGGAAKGGDLLFVAPTAQ